MRYNNVKLKERDTAGLPTTSDPDRWEKAKCRGQDPEIFFSEDPEGIAQAKTICAGCPVLTECLAEAIRFPNTIGIWGATTAKGRKRMLRLHDEQKEAMQLEIPLILGK